MTRIAAVIFAAGVLWQCGGESEETETTDDCPAALTAFKDNIQPHIKTDSCDTSGCHSSAIDDGGFAMKTGESNATSNRKGMLDEVEDHGLLDADKLWDYLSGVTDNDGNKDADDDDKHPGKDSLGGLDKAKVAAWVTAEKACSD